MVRTAGLESPLSAWIKIFYWIFLLFYIFFAVIFYDSLVVPYLELGDLMAPRLLADSITYQNICPEMIPLDEWYWLRDAGPCISLALLGQSLVLITLANALLIFISAHLMARSYKISSHKVLFLLLINPITFLSFFGPNKEVFGISCIMFLLIYLQKRTLPLLLSTLIFAFFARLPMLVIVIFFLVIIKLFKVEGISHRPWQKFRKSFLYLLLAASLISIIEGEQAQFQILGDILGADDNSTSTLISLDMESYSANGLFVLTYIVRTILNLFGAIPNLAVASLDTHGIYYVIGITGSSLLFMAMVFAMFYKRRNHLLYMSTSALHIWFFVAFITISFSLSPVIQHRYLYPLYPILILALTSRRIILSDSIGYIPVLKVGN